MCCILYATHLVRAVIYWIGINRSRSLQQVHIVPMNGDLFRL